MKKLFLSISAILFVPLFINAGCNDPVACNYNESDSDAEDCIYEGFTLSVQGSLFDSEIGWVLLDSNGNIIDEGIPYFNGSPTTRTYCLADSCYQFVMTDDFGDGWNNGTAIFSSYDGSQVYYTALGPELAGPDTITISIGTTSCTVLGCVDPGACNFNEEANQDDGLQCEYITCSGCTDPNFCEYDPEATIPDFAQCISIIGCSDVLSCLYDPLATCGDQDILCEQSQNDNCSNAIDLGILTEESYSITIDNFNTCDDQETLYGETNGNWWKFTTPDFVGDLTMNFFL